MLKKKTPECYKIQMFNEMNILIALTIDTLPHSSSPVIGSVINFLQPGKFGVCNHEQHKIL